MGDKRRVWNGRGSSQDYNSRTGFECWRLFLILLNSSGCCRGYGCYGYNGSASSGASITALYLINELDIDKLVYKLFFLNELFLLNKLFDFNDDFFNNILDVLGRFKGLVGDFIRVDNDFYDLKRTLDNGLYAIDDNVYLYVGNFRDFGIDNDLDENGDDDCYVGVKLGLLGLYGILDVGDNGIDIRRVRNCVIVLGRDSGYKGNLRVLRMITRTYSVGTRLFRGIVLRTSNRKFAQATP